MSLLVPVLGLWPEQHILIPLPIKGTRKRCCSLDPINVSKLGEAYESAAPAVGAIINSSFDEGHFVAAEKRG